MCPPYVPSLKPWMRLAVENEWPKYDAGRNVIPHSTINDVRHVSGHFLHTTPSLLFFSALCLWLESCRRFCSDWTKDGSQSTQPSTGPNLPSAKPSASSAGSSLPSARPSAPSAGSSLPSARPGVLYARPSLQSAGPSLPSAGPRLSSEGPILPSAGPSLLSAEQSLPSAGRSLPSTTLRLQVRSGRL